MSSGFKPPSDYNTPPWPSLYWPITDPNRGYFMYYPSVDIWRFTTYWTLIFIVSIYTMAGLWAFIVFSRRRYKWAILLPVFFFITGAFIAFLSGSLVGKERIRLPFLFTLLFVHHGRTDPWTSIFSKMKRGETGNLDCRLQGGKEDTQEEQKREDEEERLLERIGFFSSLLSIREPGQDKRDKQQREIRDTRMRCYPK